MNRYIISTIGLSICLLLLVGCASNVSSRYYVLNSLAAEGKVQSEESCPAIGIGPIKLPEYLNRTQIVTRTSPNELTLAYFDLWAEPLTESVPRLLGENVSQLVCTKEIVFFPWRPSHIPDVRVEVDVLKMDGPLGGSVSFEAWWSVSHGKEKISRKATYTEAIGDQSYNALVQAESRVLANLSRDIAGSIKQLK
jgi:uncharacterized protein